NFRHGRARIGMLFGARCATLLAHMVVIERRKWRQRQALTDINGIGRRNIVPARQIMPVQTIITRDGRQRYTLAYLVHIGRERTVDGTATKHDEHAKQTDEPVQIVSPHGSLRLPSHDRSME